MHVELDRHPQPALRHTPPQRNAKSLNAIQPLTPLERMAYYDPKNNQFIQLNASNVKNLHVQGKDVYVLVHGWAPGYSDWVQNYAQKYHKVLEWWDTFPTQSNYHGELDDKNLGPMSAWLLDGYPSMPGDDTVVSANGMAKDLIASDPHPKNALVLAYSWLDEAATPDGPTIIPGLPPIPEDGNMAGAKTTLNGERLAVALEQVLGSESQFKGKLQLIGHSFGSKVATVAAVALQNAPLAHHGQPAHNPRLSRIRLLWRRLSIGIRAHKQQLVLPARPDDQPEPKSAIGTRQFVDNYISAFDEPYDVISYTKSNVPSNADLNQVVDTVLYPSLNANAHSYAAEWYAGSSEGPGTTKGYKAGRLWSPLMGKGRIIPPTQF